MAEKSKGSVTITYHAESPDEAGGPVEMEVLVVDDCTGDPLPGAIVRYGGKEYTAGADGIVQLGMIAPGTYPIWADAEEYTEKSGVFTAKEVAPEEDADA